MIWILYCLSAILSLFLWNVIHEMSHILAAKILGNVKSWTIKPYPHMYNGSFRFAGAYWKWDGEVPPNGSRGTICLAPRVPDFIATELLVVALFLSGPGQILFLIFCVGGAVDLFVGSIGYSENSDFKRAERFLETDLWKVRWAGFLLCFCGVIAVLASFL